MSSIPAHTSQIAAGLAKIDTQVNLVLKLGEMIMKADSGNLYQMDLLALAAAKRHVSTAAAISQLIAAKNMVSARALLRVQIDTALPVLRFLLNHPNWLRHLYDRGQIYVLSPDVPFDPDYQIEPDAINLRLHPLAMRVRKDVVLDPRAGVSQAEEYFEPCPLPATGYELQPGQLLFCRVLETILIKSDRFLGLVLGRRNIAGFGLSIHCDQPKLPAGCAWNFPLQLQNRTQNVIRVHPYTYIAQLVLIDYGYAALRGYHGTYPHPFENYIPVVDNIEQARIGAALQAYGARDPAQINTSGRIAETLKELQGRQDGAPVRLGLFLRKRGLAPSLEGVGNILVSISGALWIVFLTTAHPSFDVKYAIIVTILAAVLLALSRMAR